MASIRKRGSKWQVQVRRNGLPAITKTFTAKDDAVRWAREQDRAIDRGDTSLCSNVNIRQTTVSDILRRYVRDVRTRKRGSVDEYHLRSISAYLDKVTLTNLRPAHLSAFRDQRLNSVAPATVAKEMDLFCHALKIATDEWGLMIPVEKFRAVRKPSPPRGRTRRLETGERERLLDALSACRNPLIKSVFNLALATGMRRGEVLSLTWSNIDWTNRVAFLPMTKNGEARRVPLSPDAIGTLQEVRKASHRSTEGGAKLQYDRVFPVSANAVRLAWERAKKRAGIEDLHFHDLRHEAISRFFEIGLSVPEVSLISGHKDARMLFRYTHLNAATVAGKLEKMRNHDSD
jgi:integrase